MSERQQLTPKQARRLWVEALRSGEYEQGTKYLRRGDSFCCLGVACQLYATHVGDVQWTDSGGDIYMFDGSNISLSERVAAWLGLRSTEGGYGIDIGRDCLTRHNDDRDSFYAIADLIESNPPGLFVEEPT